ncbi:ribosome biogenesis GTPase YlqF [Heliobacterium gestii]|uniref:Ribosome biogenesis GTPase A n=1 Tax=Heliomicrobium gestii TaxID=2699 RepID=A0A845LF35_HELGE|nr:ribosome biogenesis GTPase YlqF [Heliomicrobium gestii]MBM7867065.1 ribosome biogenesis GTPase A [Heliomicrobium gestii]MZP43520.1 ribosome biogenesis GTPase YlqF [Heliomicrobium gestii]
MSGIQWYPGHMTRARRQVAEDLAKVDLALELVDARIPFSSRNPDIDRILGEKPRVVLLNKADLADPAATRRFIDFFRERAIPALSIDAATGEGVRAIAPLVEQTLEPLLQRWKQRGMRPRAFRAMVVGIPNVGKSSLINRLAGRRRTVTADRPGVTRGPQWVRIGQKMELLDTPGILWPKFEDPLVGFKLSATGAVSDLVVQVQEVAQFILQFIAEESPQAMAERYGFQPEAVSEAEWLDAVARRRGFLGAGGVLDREKAAIQLLGDFRSGKLGRYTLDKPEEQK